MAEDTKDDDNMTVTTEDSVTQFCCCLKCLSHKCWTNGRCCCCLKCCDDEEKAQINQFTWYNIINIFRFGAIWYLIYLANESNIRDIDAYQKDCCNCYYISKTPSSYSKDILSDNRWFDLSMCVPNCINCNYCEAFFHGSANESFSYNYSAHNISYCPVANYTAPESHVAWHWKSQTGCTHRIAFTTFFFWTRSYKWYVYWAGGIIGLYVLISAVLILLACFKCQGAENQFSRIISMYNIMIGECCLYWIFMPYKYWNKPFNTNLGPNRRSITCPITAVRNGIQVWIGVMLIGLMLFVFIHIIMEIMSYCNQCCAKPPQHATQEQNQQLLENKTYKIKNSKHFCVIKFRTWFGIIFGIWILVFLIALLAAMYEIVVADVEHLDDIGDTDIVIITVSVALILSSMFDALFTGSSRQWLFKYCQHIQAELQETCSCYPIQSVPITRELVSVQ